MIKINDRFEVLKVEVTEAHRIVVSGYATFDTVENGRKTVEFSIDSGMAEYLFESTVLHPSGYAGLIGDLALSVEPENAQSLVGKVYTAEQFDIDAQARHDAAFNRKG